MWILELPRSNRIEALKQNTLTQLGKPTFHVQLGLEPEPALERSVEITYGSL